MTCNKIYDIFAPREKIRPRVNVRTGNQTTSWLFDTGAAITCMNSRSFNGAIGNQKLKKIANAQSCVAASGDAINSIGIYEIDLYIKGQKFYHPVNVINELKNNIIGIDFMHRNKLIYDVNTRQVKFADEKMNTICGTKQVTIPAMTSSIITMKFNGDSHPDKTYIAMIHCPGAPTLTGVPSLVTIDNNQNCKIVIENCTPYDVTIERNDIMASLRWRRTKCIPSQMTPRPKSAPLSKAIFQALPGFSLPETTLPGIAISKFWTNSRRNIWTSFSDIRRPSA